MSEGLAKIDLVKVPAEDARDGSPHTGGSGNGGAGNGGGGNGSNGGNGSDGGGTPPAPQQPQAEVPTIGGFKAVTDFAACLMPLLRGMGWDGDLRHVAEALPHFADTLDLTGLRNVMGNLRYQSRPVVTRLDKIDPRLMPCLFVPENHGAVVPLRLEGDGIRIYDGQQAREVVVPRATAWKGTAYVFSPLDAEDAQAQQSKIGWFRTISERFRGLVYQILAITLVLNLLALATPLFVKSVYDKVVATGSLSTLGWFGMGVGIALLSDIMLRAIRARILAYVGARMDNLIGNAVFHRILFLPPAFTERATIGAQVARIKDFESVRDFFTGPMAMVMFELPFVVIFIAVIAILGGPVAFVPIIMIVLFVLVGVVMLPMIRQAVARSARSGSKRQEFVVESLGHMRAIRYTGCEDVWFNRYRQFSAVASMNNFHSGQLSGLVQTISHVLMMSAGVATIAFGVFRVLSGDMTAGGLVASMILVWRVLAPLQTGFVTMTRLEQVRASINQLNSLMQLRPERDPNTPFGSLRKIKGQVTFSRVSLRYRPDADPALIGVAFEADPGDVVAILGGNGSGKSTVLKLINGMYQPQAGNIRIDNLDIRQMDIVELRHAVAYVPQVPEFFYGTIAQNLRLAKPTATDEDLEWATKQANVYDDIMAMSSGDGKWKRVGFEARVPDYTLLPTSFQQRLSLARAYAKKAPILLLDEPGNGLDFEDDKKFMKTLDEMRGNQTVFIVTHRPSHVRMADKIVWLEEGYMRMAGPAQEVRKRMPEGFL